MKQQIIEKIEKNKIVVIIRGVEREKLIPVVSAMYNGGIRIVECTFDASGVKSDESVASDISMLTEHFGDSMVIGAGTVITQEQVELTKKAGGKFIISPDTYCPVIEKANELGLVSIPGAITPTEVSDAHRSGADFVKLFPIDLYGAKYIKTLKAPLSHIRLMAVNGITAENMCEYINAGACAVGVGSGVVNKDLIAKGDFEAIKSLAKKYTENI